jgi:hypothetical protein
MNNEALIRGFIRGSIHRALLESVAALIVLIFFGALLPGGAIRSPSFYGCLLILVGTGFVLGVVWSHALTYRLLRSHPASDARFWREAFHAQARLARLAPLWYCAPLGAGGILFVAPKALEEFVPFLMVGGMFIVVFAVAIWVNRRAALCIEESAKLLAD